ncbi:MAG: histidine phosphatase family protein [Candidatus Kaiserbacteria bacterium]|nr:histidine phosphatase family protein [Candidatus Kaiserbacteria bacterium]MCB9815811.1 histidine phosphatase family protein [Candidatus Nomurabacteria bacterium]
MEIYLVRHGQTDGNLQRRHQVEHSVLTKLGKEQAEEAGKELKKFKPTHLVASSLVRAIETARIIGEECDLTPEISSHFIEIARPKEMYGRHHFSLSSLWFYFWWYFGSKHGTNNGGESYKQFRQRFTAAQEYLAALPEDSRVVVVSHGVFITFFTIHICNKKWMGPLRALKVYADILSIKNGSITKVVYDTKAKKRECAWSVVK